MRVLLTNITLASRSGTEVNVRDLALGLLRRGHRPVVYSPELGEIAAEIRAATVPVVDDLAAVAAPPDVIHGHHHPTTLTALLRFPGVPAIYHVHDWSAWYDEPLRFPRVVLYAPVDETNADRLELEHGIDRARIRLMLNAVDLTRCPPRPPLPAVPRRALVLSNAAKEGGYLDAVRAACDLTGLELDVVGSGVGRTSARPEELLAGADVVFAKGRSALEAMAAGAAVILCDEIGLGELVTAGRVGALRPLNFGRRLLQRPVTVEGVAAEIARYDATDAARVTEWVRREADLEAALDRLVGVYEETIALGQQVPSAWEEESRAVSAYLQRWAPRFHDFEAAVQLPALRRELEQATPAAAQAMALGGEVAALRSDLASERERAESAAAEAAVLRAGFAAEVGHSRRAAAETAALRRELAAVTSTAAWRWRQRLLARPQLAAIYRLLKRSRAATSDATSELTAGSEAPSTAPRLSIGERAAQMVSAGGFLGVPLDGFEEEGRLQLATLLQLGLRPQSKLLDIGCGCLRGGYWLIHFLDAGCYCGIEPHRRRLELGLSLLLEPGVADARRPRFDSNPDFDSAVFGERFDVFLARSIWTHASKAQIQRMLDGFQRDGAPGALFLTSYMPAAKAAGDDYCGSAWVGTSHESDVPGVIRHDLGWIRDECAARGLAVEERPEDDYGGQRWLLLRRAGA
jgi:glycosyl transferase family 4